MAALNLNQTNLRFRFLPHYFVCARMSLLVHDLALLDRAWLSLSNQRVVIYARAAAAVAHRVAHRDDGRAVERAEVRLDAAA